jgi:phosphoenolpyruvate synthase/pyruvate phosphate dikinase
MDINITTNPAESIMVIKHNTWTDGEPHPNNVIHLRIDGVEGRVSKLEELFERQMQHDVETHQKLEQAMTNVVTSQTHTNEKLDELITQLKEPLEDFNMRKFGKQYFRQIISDSKMWLIIGAGIIVVALITNASTMLDIIKAVKG